MNLRERLRSETLKDHDAIEGVIPVLNKDFNRDHYGHLLKKLYGFFEPFEQHMQNELQKDPFVQNSERRRAPRLMKDLMHLGFSNSEIENLPKASKFPYVTNLSALTGVLYVIEGSSLGGQMITQHLLRSLGEEIPVFYFNCYGPNTGIYWREFAAWLGTVEGKVDAEIVIESARETFRCLNSWMRS